VAGAARAAGSGGLSRAVVTIRRRQSAWRGARLVLAAVLAVAVLATTAGAAAGRTVRVPVTLDAPFLSRLLVEQVFTEENGTARSRPRMAAARVALSKPSVDFVEGRVRVVARHGRGSASGSAAPAGTCSAGMAEWRSMRSRSSRQSGPRCASTWWTPTCTPPRLAGGGRLWEWIKPAVHPRLETLR